MLPGQIAQTFLEWLAAAGLRHAEDRPLTYDGAGTIACIPELLPHEIAHWAVASEIERSLPEWGLGSDPGTWRPGAPVVLASLSFREIVEVEAAADFVERALLSRQGWGRLLPNGLHVAAKRSDPRVQRGLAELRRVGLPYARERLERRCPA